MVDHDLVILTLERQRQEDYREFRDQPGLEWDPMGCSEDLQWLSWQTYLKSLLVLSSWLPIVNIHLVAGCASCQVCPLEVQWTHSYLPVWVGDVFKDHLRLLKVLASCHIQLRRLRRRAVFIEVRHFLNRRETLIFNINPLKLLLIDSPAIQMLKQLLSTSQTEPTWYADLNLHTPYLNYPNDVNINCSCDQHVQTLSTPSRLLL